MARAGSMKSSLTATGCSCISPMKRSGSSPAAATTVAFFVGLYAAVIPHDTALWAKAIIIAGGFSIEAIWYGLVAMLLSTPAARTIYVRLGRWIERLIGTLLVGFGLRLICDRF